MRPFHRTMLTRMGVFTAHPASFVIVAVYVAAWLVIDPGSFDWHAIATIATWFMTLIIGLKATITRRKAFPNAAGFGLSVDELVPLDPKACAELAALVRELSAMVEHMVSYGR
jgi:hypothetical protein